MANVGSKSTVYTIYGSRIEQYSGVIILVQRGGWGRRHAALLSRAPVCLACSLPLSNTISRRYWAKSWIAKHRVKTWSTSEEVYVLLLFPTKTTKSWGESQRVVAAAAAARSSSSSSQARGSHIAQLPFTIYFLTQSICIQKRPREQKGEMSETGKQPEEYELLKATSSVWKWKDHY